MFRLCLAFIFALIGTAGLVVAQPVGPVSQSGSIVVTPFVNVSRDVLEDWIGTGIAETVATAFDDDDGFTVVRDRDETSSGGSERLTSLVVTGGYQRIGNTIRHYRTGRGCEH